MQQLTMVVFDSSMLHSSVQELASLDTCMHLHTSFTLAQVDVLAFETIPSAKEVAAVAQLLKEREAQAAAPGQDNPAIQQPLQMGPGPAGQGIENNTVHERVCPAWVSVSCKDSSHTCAGDSFAEDVVPLLWGCDSVIGIGINCTAPQHVSALLAAGAAKLKQLTEQDQDGGSGRRTGPPPFLLCYPNSGEGWDGEHRCWLPDADGGSTPGGFAAKAAEWVKAGAAAVGGCCRTGPAHIQELKRILKATSSTCAS
jgi:S-methylmethionine-dependent homocysteine/selenocysteine methylase